MPCQPFSRLLRRTFHFAAALATGAAALAWAHGSPAVASQSAPEQPATQPAAPATAPAPIELDERWLGRWEGSCRVLQPGGLVAGQFTMGLTISRMEEDGENGLPQYNWTIVYDNGQTQQTRPYILKPAVDDNGRPVPGHYLIDEQNGIVVDQFLVGDTMQGHFIVAAGERQTVLHARYALEEAEDGSLGLLVEIASYDGNFARASGEADNGVVSRPMRSVQTGLLLRQGEGSEE